MKMHASSLLASAFVLALAAASPVTPDTTTSSTAPDAGSSVASTTTLDAASSSTTSVEASSSTAAASTATFTPPRPRLRFTVKQKSIGKKLITYPPRQMLGTYNKFNKAAPSAVKSAATATVSGSVANNPAAYDEAYLAPVTVGGTNMNLNFDTGSADLWVFSDLLPAAQQKGHDIYKTSAGSPMNGYTWAITYGDGSGASGKVYQDKIVVGGVTATAQAVEAATSVSSAFIDDVDSDGLLGLAFSSINTVEPNVQTTFFDTIRSKLAMQVFTATLKKGKSGSYDFGYIDATKYKGNITYIPVIPDNGFWEFQAGGYMVGKTKFSAKLGDSIMDTGTTLLYLPPRPVANYYAQVRGATNNNRYGGWTFPCASKLPDLQILLGNTYFTVPGSYINYAPITSTTCFGGLQNNVGIGFNIFGDIFMKAAFVVFDLTQGLDKPRMGIAKQAP